MEKDLAELDQESFIKSMTDSISNKVKSNDINIQDIIQQTMQQTSLNIRLSRDTSI